MKVLLVDDDLIFLDGLSLHMKTRGIEVLGTACDGLKAYEMARELLPEVILMDINMPRVNGIVATKLIKAELPDIKVVMLTMSTDDKDLFDSLKSGACGYLLKTEGTEKFFGQFMGLEEGKFPLSESLANRDIYKFTRGVMERNTKKNEAEPDVLSERQRRVLRLVAQGLSYRDAAEQLNLTEFTIKYHMGKIITRLNLKNRSEAIQYARNVLF